MTREAKVVCAFLAFAAVAGATRGAGAAEPHAFAVRVQEDLHEGCPRTPPMLDCLEARLARVRGAAPGEPAIDVEVRVERRGGVSHGTVVLASGGERAERTASSASCERVLVALAVMAAVGLDEGQVEAPPRDARTAPPPVAPTPPSSREPRLAARPGESSEPTSAPAPVAPSRRPLGVGLGTAVDASANRRATLAPAIFAQLTLPVATEPLLRLALSRSFPQVAVSRRGTAGLRWTEATVAGCIAFTRHPSVEAGPCVSLGGGVLEAIVVEPLPSRVRSKPWLTAGASARLAWKPLRAVSFELQAGARAPLVRSELFFEPATMVYEAPLVLPFASAGIVAHLP